VGDIAGVAGEEVIDTNYLMSIGEDEVAEMRRDEAGRSGNKKTQKCSPSS
jgi:hypothetical protein